MVVEYNLLGVYKNMNNIISYIIFLFTYSIVPILVWIQITHSKNINLIFNPIYIVSLSTLIINIIVNITPNISKKIIKLNKYISLVFYISASTVLYYRNMLCISSNLNLVAVNSYEIYYKSYGLLFMSYIVMIMFLKRNLFQDLVITSYQLLVTVLCLLIEIYFIDKYYTDPNFGIIITINNACQFLMMFVCSIYRIINYTRQQNNNKIVNIFDTLFYVITLIISITQTIRINNKLNYINQVIYQ